MQKRIIQGLIATIALLMIGALAWSPMPTIHAQEEEGGGQTQPGQAQWRGIYFRDAARNNLLAEATYPTGLNENWGTGRPTDGFGQPLNNVPPDDFFARFSTSVELQGIFEFTITADDDATFFINGQQLAQTTGAGRTTATTGLLNLTGGTYLLTVDYREGTGEASIAVTWSGGDQAGTPQPTETPVPPAFAEVVSVRGLAVRTGPFLGASLIGVARPDEGFDPGVEDTGGEVRGYPILARNTQEGIFTWYQIRLNEDTVGWSSGRYLEITGNIDAVPLIESTQFDVINQTPTFDVIGQTRSTMNLRIYPSERVQRVPEKTQLEWGETVEILARTRQGGRDFWYQVRVHDSEGNERYGWIFAPYVEILDGQRAPIDAIPVY